MQEEQAQTLSEAPRKYKQTPETGNLKICFNNEFLHLSLGPDYCMFIMAYMGFLSISLVFIYILMEYAEDFWFKFTSILIASITPITYLSTALKDPGIFDPVHNIDPKIKYCNTCRTFIPKNCKHCTRCNVCIEQHDHHCPWISKCIGKNNKCCFYMFLISIPITLIYIWIGSVICLTEDVPSQSIVV